MPDELAEEAAATPTVAAPGVAVAPRTSTDAAVRTAADGFDSAAQVRLRTRAAILAWQQTAGNSAVVAELGRQGEAGEVAEPVGEVERGAAGAAVSERSNAELTDSFGAPEHDADDELEAVEGAASDDKPSAAVTSGELTMAGGAAAMTLAGAAVPPIAMGSLAISASISAAITAGTSTSETDADEREPLEDGELVDERVAASGDDGEADEPPVGESPPAGPPADGGPPAIPPSEGSPRDGSPIRGATLEQPPARPAAMSPVAATTALESMTAPPVRPIASHEVGSAAEPVEPDRAGVAGPMEAPVATPTPPAAAAQPGSTNGRAAPAPTEPAMASAARRADGPSPAAAASSSEAGSSEPGTAPATDVSAAPSVSAASSRMVDARATSSRSRDAATGPAAARATPAAPTARPSSNLTPGFAERGRGDGATAQRGAGSGSGGGRGRARAAGRPRSGGGGGAGGGGRPTARAAAPARPRPLGDASLEAWRSASSSAVQSVPPGDLSDAAEGASELEGEGDAIDANRRSEQPDFDADARAEQPPMPQEAPKAETLDTAPADAALTAVRDAGEVRLPDQTFAPLGTPPAYPGLNPADFVPRRQRLAVEQLEARLENADLTPAEQASLTRQLEQAKAAVAAIEQAAREGTPVAESPTVVDEGAASLEPPPREQAELLGDAIARALNSVDSTAQGITDEALEIMHGDGVDAAIQLANRERPTVRSELETELRGIADAAGFTEEQLDAKMVEQEQALTDEQAAVAEGLQAASVTATQRTQERADEEVTDIASARASVDEENQQRHDAVQGPPDTEEIERTRDDYLGRIRTVGAQAKAALRGAMETRRTDLQTAARQHTTNATQAANTQAAAIRRHWSEDSDPNKGMAEARPTVSWGRTRGTEIDAEARRLTTASQRSSDAAISAADDTITSSRDAVRDWAAAQQGQERSWWDRLLDEMSDWFGQAGTDNEAWERQRNAQSRDRMAADFTQLTQMRQAREAGNAAAYNRERAALSAEQRQLADAYFGGGISGIEYVSRSTIARIQDRRVPELATSMEQTAVAEWGWEDLNQLAQVTNSGFNASVLGNQIRGAIAGVGTNEDQVFSGLGGARSAVERAALEKFYADTFDTSLSSDIEGDLSDAALDRAEALRTGQAAVADAAAIRDAVSGLGTDEDTIKQALRGRSPAELEAIRSEYRRMYGVELGTDLEEDLSDAELDTAVALAEGDVDAADAAELQEAMEGAGTDEEGLRRVFERIREEESARARREGLSTAELQERIQARNARVSEQYGQRYGDLQTNMTAELADIDEGAVGRLEERGSPLVNSADIRLMGALQSGDPAEIDAMRALAEHESIYTDDDEIEDVVRDQRSRADLEVNLDLAAERARIRAQFESGDLTPDEYRDMSADWQGRFDRRDDAIATRARSNVNELRGAYSEATGGRQTFDQLVVQETSGYSQLEIQDLVAAGGQLSPEQEIYYATAGAGTDEDMIRQQLANRTPEEIERIRVAYERRHPGHSFDSDILGDLSGREDLDIGHTLEHGDPATFGRQLAEARTPEDRQRILAAMQTVLDERRAFEETGTIGALMSAGLDPMNSADQMALALRRAEEFDDALSSSESQPAEEGAPPDPALAAAQARVEMTMAGAVEAQEQVRQQIDGYADVAAQVGAAVAGIAVTIVTAGAAGPAVAALYGALASAAATMALKSQLRGAAYSWEEAGVDVATGVVDAGVSVLTAGMGRGITDAIEAAIRNQLIRRAATEGAEEVSEAVMRTMLRDAMGEAIEGGIGAMPSAMVGAMLDDRTWNSSDPWGAIMSATGQAGLMGAGLGVGMHAGGEAIGAVRRGMRGADADARVDVDVDADGGRADAETSGDGTAPADVPEPHLPSSASDVELDLPPAADPRVAAEAAARGDVPPGAPDHAPRTAGADDTQVDVELPDRMRTEAREPHVGEDGMVDLDDPRNRWMLEDSMAGQAPVATDEAASRQLFEGFVDEQPQLESALMRNTETGEFIVVQGAPTSVDIRQGHGVWEDLIPPDHVGTGRWEMVVHSHPADAATGVTRPSGRVPSGADGDFAWAVHYAEVNGGPVTQEIRITTEQGPATTRYGYDPGSDTPYWIDAPGPNGSRRPERFATIEDYHDWYQQHHGGTMTVPDGFRGRRRTAPTTEGAPTSAIDDGPTQEIDVGDFDDEPTVEIDLDDMPTQVRERPDLDQTQEIDLDDMPTREIELPPVDRTQEIDLDDMPIQLRERPEPSAPDTAPRTPDGPDGGSSAPAAATEFEIPPGGRSVGEMLDTPGYSPPAHARRNPELYYFDGQHYRPRPGVQEGQLEAPRLGRGEDFDPGKRRPRMSDFGDVPPAGVDRHSGARTDPEARVGVWHEELPNHMEGREAIIAELEASATTTERQELGHRVERRVAEDHRAVTEDGSGLRVTHESGDRTRIGDVGQHEVTLEGQNGPFGSSKLDQLWRDLVDRGNVHLIVPHLHPSAERQLAQLAAIFEEVTGRRPSIGVRELLPPPAASPPVAAAD